MDLNPWPFLSLDGKAAGSLKGLPEASFLVNEVFPRRGQSYFGSQKSQNRKTGSVFLFSSCLFQKARQNALYVYLQ